MDIYPLLWDWLLAEGGREAALVLVLSVVIASDLLHTNPSRL